MAPSRDYNNYPSSHGASAYQGLSKSTNDLSNYTSDHSAYMGGGGGMGYEEAAGGRVSDAEVSRIYFVLERPWGGNTFSPFHYLQQQSVERQVDHGTSSGSPFISVVYKQ